LSDARTRAGTLLVDIGNTRVKWARLAGGKLGRQHAAAHTGWTSEDFARALFGKQRANAVHERRGGGSLRRARAVARRMAHPLAGRRSSAPARTAAASAPSAGMPTGGSGALERILVVSVAGPRVDDALRAAAKACTGIEPEFFTSKRRAGGVTTQYSEPWRLGADRLVAAIGAHRLARGRAVCVIAVGTALTLDLVDDHGRHRGGAIVPAPGLMKDSLLTKTNGIRRRAQGGSPAGAFFARSTRAAIEQGTRYAAAAVIDRAVAEARKVIGRPSLVLLTGGGAPALRRLIKSRHRFVPDLVLQGLAVLAANPTRP
jgi:type III pantothenate kinase